MFEISNFEMGHRRSRPKSETLILFSSIKTPFLLQKGGWTFFGKIFVEKNLENIPALSRFSLEIFVEDKDTYRI